MLTPLMNEILEKLQELEEKVDAVIVASSREYLKVKEVADECGVTVQSIHKHLARNPNLEPDKDFFMRGGKYYLTLAAANKLKKQLAKNG